MKFELRKFGKTKSLRTLTQLKLTSHEDQEVHQAAAWIGPFGLIPRPLPRPPLPPRPRPRPKMTPIHQNQLCRQDY